MLDLSPAKIEMRYNSEWLAHLTFADVLRLAARMTVARMLERDTFEIRYKAGDPIGVHEFLYPLMQAYDSVVIEADVELGGTDQTFNCLAGRDLMRDAGRKPQVVLTMPLLVGLDGADKMSKSKGNYVAVTDPPGEMFGKIMSLPDGLMENYFTLLTAVPMDEVRRTLKATHPREAKERLAKSIVTRYYGAGAAEAAAEEFRRRFSQGQAPSEVPKVAIPPCDWQQLYWGKQTKQVGLASVIKYVGCASSNSEAMRLMKQGAVRVDGNVVTDPRFEVSTASSFRLQVGPLHWRDIEFKAHGPSGQG